MDETTTFETTHFSAGRFRLAYKGTYTKPYYKKGRKCVVKEMKDTFTWKRTDWDETVDIVKQSQELAKGFNSYSNNNRPVKFADVAIHTVTQSAGRPKLNEFVAVEDYIPGDYVKWCNNYGTITPGSTSMPAFVHWSWAHTKGETMIADLQGVKNDDSYYLTDPCLLSATNGGKYGCTDMGIEGMAMFFINHTCTDFCKYIPKPSVQGVSQAQLAAAIRSQQQISTSTAFSHEVTFPQYVRDALIPAFKKIAQGASV